MILNVPTFLWNQFYKKQILLRNGRIEWQYYKKPAKQILPQKDQKSAIESWENAKGINK